MCVERDSFERFKLQKSWHTYNNIWCRYYHSSRSVRSALLICGKSRFFVRCCTNPLSLRSNEDWYGGTWIHWWFGQASSLMRYWIVGSAPIPKWFEMCWPEMNSKISKLKNIWKLVISYSALIECERSDVLLLSIIASKLENDSGTFDSVRFGFWQV